MLGGVTQRRLFVGLDFDVQAVDWPQPWMRTLATVLTFVRIPAPALEVYPRARWHWLFF